jgi:hypothetical protein
VREFRYVTPAPDVWLLEPMRRALPVLLLLCFAAVVAVRVWRARPPRAPAAPPSPMRAGCRTPDDPGCERCAVREPHGGCFVHSRYQLPWAMRLEDLWTSLKEGPPPGPVPPTPYYEAEHHLTCPPDLPLCAQCSAVAEWQLTHLGGAGCTCPTRRVGDACFFADSCECICEQRERLLDECPELRPDGGV